MSSRQRSIMAAELSAAFETLIADGDLVVRQRGSQENEPVSQQLLRELVQRDLKALLQMSLVLP